MNTRVKRQSALLNLAMNSGDEPVAKSLPVWNLDRRFIASFSNARQSLPVKASAFYAFRVARKNGQTHLQKFLRQRSFMPSYFRAIAWLKL